MKYILRIIVLPFVTGLHIVAHLRWLIFDMWNFIRYGGEFIKYDKDERIKINDLYRKLKELNNSL